MAIFYVQENYEMNISNINDFINLKNYILSNGYDRSGSERHIVGEMSVANFV